MKTLKSLKIRQGLKARSKKQTKGGVNMFKKALVLGTLGLMLTSGLVFAGGNPCPGDSCQVNNPIKTEFGLNLNVDVDVCVDAGNIMGDFWSVEALIYQSGDENTASIAQSSVSQTAAVVQLGNLNQGYVTQLATNNYAFTYQAGNQNYASTYQTLQNAAATILQLGSGNVGSISQ